MAKKLAPTRANLIKSKNKLAFATKGYDLLDKKRTVLIQEIVKLLDESEEIEGEITEIFDEAYKALQECSIELGINSIRDYSLSVPEEHQYQLRKRSVMGVDIPELVLDEEDLENNAHPGVVSNSPALDVAIQKFNEVKKLSYRLAEVENTAFKLAQEIKKTSKSANALSKILMPELTQSIHYIEDSLEEKEREEHFRVKKVKKYNKNRSR